MDTYLHAEKHFLLQHTRRPLLEGGGLKILATTEKEYNEA